MLKSFLPDDEPCNVLPNEFVDWYQITQTNDVEKINTLINKLEYKDIDYDKYDIKTLKLIYVTLVFITHSYIWRNKGEIKKLPETISLPFLNISKLLGIEPVLTHAVVDLWNWKLIDKKGKIEVENMELIYSFTNDISEKYFFLSMTEIEAYGKDIIPQLCELPSLIKNYDIKKPTQNIINILNNFSIVLEKIVKVFEKIRKVNPEFFFNVLRIFLNGWDKLGGLEFEGFTNIKYHCMGGSAAQSSLIQFFDIVLDVQHNTNTTGKYLKNIRLYMPREHREFLEEQERKFAYSSLWKFIFKFGNNELKQMYNKCIDKLCDFRNAHRGITVDYIKKFVNDGKGTGGTDFSIFLEDCHIETIKNKIY